MRLINALLINILVWMTLFANKRTEFISAFFVLPTFDIKQQMYFRAWVLKILTCIVVFPRVSSIS